MAGGTLAAQPTEPQSKRCLFPLTLCYDNSNAVLEDTAQLLVAFMVRSHDAIWPRGTHIIHYPSCAKALPYEFVSDLTVLQDRRLLENFDCFGDPLVPLPAQFDALCPELLRRHSQSVQ